jgi:hypothetical protein
MALYAFATPVLPGKVDEWKQLCAEMNGPRCKEYTESRRKAGLKQELVWDETTPNGDLAVVIFDTDDFEGVIRYFSTSKAPFDVWFSEKIMKGIHGVDLSKGLPPLKPISLWKGDGCN